VGVPQEVLNRPKQGFALPLVHWMRGELKDDLLPVLLEPRTLARGYFNPKAIRVLLEEHRRGRRDHSAQIWMLLMFELWHRNFLESRSFCASVEMPVVARTVGIESAQTEGLSLHAHQRDGAA
jgi:asparagine synthetase B (glutamine-hydrolysing)